MTLLDVPGPAAPRPAAPAPATPRPDLTGPEPVRVELTPGRTASPPHPAAGSPRRPGPPGDPGAPRRRGTRSSTFLLPPWTRAPLLAFRQPAVILAVLGAAAILACASSSAALFLSSASSESLRQIIAADCPDASYPTVSLGPLFSRGTGPGQPSNLVPSGAVDDVSALDQRARSAMSAAGLAQPSRLIDAAGFVSAVSGQNNQLVNLFYRDGATSNITPLSRTPVAGGLWLPRTLATQLSVRAGDRVRIRLGPRSTGPLQVAGVYRDLADEPVSSYWCSYTELFQNPSYGNDSSPPALLLTTDPTVYDQVQQATGVPATFTWVSPIHTDRMTLSDARSLTARQDDAYRRLGVAAPQDLGAQNSGPGQLPVFAQRTSLIRNGLRGPVVPIALGGTILALLLVGAAGSYWADRRIREVRLLASRGVGPTALAGKAVLELALPAIAGTVLGWLLARWLVVTLGPNPHLDRAAPAQAGLTAALALLAGLTLLAVVAGLRSRTATERPLGLRRSWLSMVPWELALLAAAGLCYLRLTSGDAVVLDRNIAQVNLLVVAFPLLFLLGAAILVVRLLVPVLSGLSRLAGRRSAAWYLAGRRITSSRTVSLILLAAAALPIAVLVYAAGLTQTSQYTLQSKADLFVGSHVAISSVDPISRNAQTDRVGTIVNRYLYAQVEGTDAAVLGIDPKTFAGTAFWDRRFANSDLPELLARLRGPAPDGRIPVLVAGGAGVDWGSVGSELELRLGYTRAKVQVVDTARLFPGRHLPQPMVVVDATRLGPVDPHAGSVNELWSRQSVDQARAAVRSQQARVFDTTDQQSVFRVANFLGISWTFGYLTALAALVGLVAIGGLLLYLETRQRSRVASYALGRRMGLTRPVHLHSLLAELATLLGTAYLVGGGLAGVAVLLVYARLDVDSSRPPAPLLTVPTLALLGSAGAVAVVTVLASMYAQRSADRADVAEVLRLGT